MSEETIFATALEKSAPAERAAYLDAACSGDPELRRRIETLLVAHEQSGDLLDPRGHGPGTESEPAPAAGEGWSIAEGVGSRIGPYRLTRKIGEGGMGVVFLAEQEHPVRRTVALKVIKPGMDTAQVIARLEAERQALALMDHPHIARFLDAGATDTGRPFFVMELVDGVPITEYCDRERLTPRERLELFVPVCQAIQHAHQKGIIHRDIKPTNVLVARRDGGPMPKVIDFGVAKAVGRELAERTLFTQLGIIVGTPEYMSPEQARLSGLEVDTRSDIYALGVLLYELLTGTTPLEHRRLREAAFTEVLRRIREEEPQKPSTRLGPTQETASIAARRGTEPAKLARLVRGDLDWIVMKALEKEPARRYETANGLAQDIQRHLEGDPVEAGPPSSSYRLRKFARKHRGVLATGSALASVLLASTAISTWQAVRARRAEAETRRERDAAIDARKAEEEARRRAEAAETAARAEADKAVAINGFLTDDLLSQAEPASNAAEDHVTLLVILDRAAEKVGARLGGRPEIEDSLRRTIAETYHGLASWDKAERQWRSVLESSRRRYGPESREALTALGQVAHVLRHRGGKDAEVLAMARAAHDGLARVLGADHPDTVESRSNLALACLGAGRTDEAITLLEAMVKADEARLGADHPRTLTGRNNLASAYHDAGRTDEAITLLEATIKRQQSSQGADHPDTIDSRRDLAGIYLDAGRAGDAIALLESLIHPVKSRLGPDHPDTIDVLGSLARAYLAEGRVASAVPLYEEVLRLDRGRLGPDDPTTIHDMQNLAVAYRGAGRLAEAVPLLERALAAMKAGPAADRPSTLLAMTNLGVMYREAGRGDEALAMFREVVGLMKARRGPDHPDTLYAQHNLAVSCAAAGRRDEAIGLFDEVVRRCKVRLGPGHPSTLASAEGLIGVYLDAQRWPEAASVARECLESRTRQQPDDWQRFHTMSLLGAAMAGQARYADAEPLVIGGYEGLKSREASIPAPARGRLRAAAARIVPLYEAWGRPDRAAEWRAKLAPPAAAKPSP